MDINKVKDFFISINSNLRMNTILTLSTTKLRNIYDSLSLLHKVKEKTDMILEPLQSMVQLALLSISPIGTKIAIYDNILHIQNPSVVQPIARWYYADKKDDLYFLFQVIKRFMKWYGPKATNSPISADLYRLLVTMTIRGLDNLVVTYEKCESMALVQIIRLYQSILQNENEIAEIESLELNKRDNKNIDEVFENILTLYDQDTINIIHHSLLLLQNEKSDEHIKNYIDGLNLMMAKINGIIKHWIKTNLLP